MSPTELNESAIPYKPEGYPLSPYQQAQAEWDSRIGTAREQAKNWRIMALSLVLLLLIVSGGLVYLLTQSRVVPYVVEVNRDGLVQAVGPAPQRPYTPSKAVLHYFLSQFVVYVRSVPLDPIVAKNHWLSAYNYLRQEAANTLSEIARREQPLERVGRETVAVQVKSIVALSKDSYQVRWEESSYTPEGGNNGVKNMTGLFTIEIAPPSDEKMLKTNPLGLYIKHFNWSQDM